jgi:D-alanyl-D-alanine carboxypeptidase (penicillin-binding protein 5/6)
MRWLGRNRAVLAPATVLWLCAAVPLAWSQPASVDASAAVLIDAATRTVLFHKAMHERRFVASTTKIATALVALESADLDEPVTVSARAGEVTPSSLDLRPGEVLTMDDLLAALLLNSANDAAVAIAEHVAGGVPAFAQLMNQRAHELGAIDTNFVNPHGLHDPSHYSSAYDLGLITQEALKHPRFRELVASKAADISRSAADGPQRIFNHNKLLWRADFVDGVKTGYVRQSGQCLVASATKDGWQLIAVLLDSPDLYEEALGLLRYGFTTYRQKVYARRGDALGRAPVRRGRLGRVAAVCEHPLTTVLGPDLPSEGRLEVSLKPLSAPVKAGDDAGEARLITGDQLVARSRLFAAQDVPKSRLVVAAVWTLRAILLAVLAALLVRTYAKALKGHRRRWRNL